MGKAEQRIEPCRDRTGKRRIHSSICTSCLEPCVKCLRPLRGDHVRVVIPLQTQTLERVQAQLPPCTREYNSIIIQRETHATKLFILCAPKRSASNTSRHSKHGVSQRPEITHASFASSSAHGLSKLPTDTDRYRQIPTDTDEYPRIPTKRTTRCLWHLARSSATSRWDYGA